MEMDNLKAGNGSTPTSDSNTAVDRLEESNTKTHHEQKISIFDEVDDNDGPEVYQKMCWKLFTSLIAMSFLWVGSQIGLFLFGSALVQIYSEIGGADGIWLWMVIGYLIPNSALCPFVGALSDLFGRRYVAAVGQVLLIAGPAIVATSHSMHQAIPGMVVSGLGAGLNELISLAGTSELVPARKRTLYVAGVVFTITPFIPSPMWAQLIVKGKNWRYIGFLVGGWNLIGLILVLFFYHGPSSAMTRSGKTAKDILRTVDYIGGILSTVGVTLFMLGMQFGAQQYSWSSAQVLVPFLLGVAIIIAFFVWEVKYAPYPMVPAAMFSKDKRTMILVLFITFFSGGNFFVMLLFWPTQVYNVYGDDPIGIGIRTLPIGTGIIFGAAFNLLLISWTKGRTTILMVFWCVVMTAFTGAVSIADRHNLNPTVYAILTIANVGVGAIIIPCAIIAQIICPTEYIGTVTAIGLSIRYIGGAIGFTAYYNVFYHKMLEEYSLPAALNVALAGVTDDYETLFGLMLLAAQSRWQDLRDLIAGSPNVYIKGDEVYDFIILNVQEAFVLAYRWPYWISVAFGGVCCLCALGMRDIRHVLEKH